MIGTIIYWVIGITICLVFLGVAWEYMPAGFKKLVGNFFKKIIGGQKK